MKFFLKTFSLILLFFSTNNFANTNIYLGLGFSKLGISTNNLKTRILELNKYAYNENQLPSEPRVNSQLNNIYLGYLIDDYTKIEFNYQQSPKINNSNQSFYLQNFNIFYLYNFNNQGLNKGFYVGAGISDLTLKFYENLETHAKNLKTLDFSLAFGYQYQFNKKVFINIGTKVPYTINIRLNSKNKKELQYKKLPSNWDEKSDSYKTTNKYKYFADFYYTSEKTLVINEITISINYILD